MARGGGGEAVFLVVVVRFGWWSGGLFSLSFSKQTTYYTQGNLISFTLFPFVEPNDPLVYSLLNSISLPL